MASDFFWCYDYGAETNDRGTTRSTGVANWNWSSNSDPTTTYSDNPITAGNAGYNLYGFPLWTGTYNQISSVKVNHTYNSTHAQLGAGLTVAAFVSGSGVGGAGFYNTPSDSVDARLTHNLTSTGAVSTGLTVLVGAFGPEFSGKGSASAVTPVVYGEYCVTQLQTTSAASPGDIPTVTWSISYNES